MYAYTGGKTGGHILPLLSIMESHNSQDIYIGEEGNLEEKLCNKRNIPFIGYKKKSNKIITLFYAFFYLKTHLKKYKIDALITSGGYVSLPACIYAFFKRIPIFLIEENVIIGSLNKIMKPFCKKIFWVYPPKKIKHKDIVSGLPLRKKGEAPSSHKYDVLVIGGSLGSKVLCDVAYKIGLKYKVCLLAGRYIEEYPSKEGVDSISFEENIYELMKNSKVIIARAGASTAQEIFYMNKPFLCIPSEKTKKNHQVHNAIYFKNQNACILCREDEIDKVSYYVEKLLNDEVLKKNMGISQRKLVQEDAAQKILKEIKESI